MTEAEIAAKKVVDDAALAAQQSSIANMSTAGGKTPEQLVAEEAARIAAGATTKTPEEIAAEAAAAAAAETKFTPNTYWGNYKEKYGIEMPEILAGESVAEDVNESDLMFQAIQSKVLNSLPPQVREFYSHMSENKSAEEFYKAKVGESGYLTLPDEQFANEFLRRAHGKSEANPEGLSDEVISEKVQKLVDNGTLDLMVLGWKADAKKDIEESKSDVNVQAQADAAFNTSVENVKGNLNVFYEKSLKGVTNINGIDVDQEAVNSFKPLFEKIVMPDKALGTSPWNVMQNDNTVLFNMLWSMFNSKDAINNILSNAKEESKKSLLKVLDIEPITTHLKSDETDVNVKISKFATSEKH